MPLVKGYNMVKEFAKKARKAVKKDREERLHPALKKAGKKYGDRAIKHFEKSKKSSKCEKCGK